MESPFWNFLNVRDWRQSGEGYCWKPNAYLDKLLVWYNKAVFKVIYTFLDVPDIELENVCIYTIMWLNLIMKIAMHTFSFSSDCIKLVLF